MEYIAASIVTKIVEKKALGLTEKVINYVTENIKLLNDTGLEEYLSKNLHKFSNTKTILKGATSVDFYEVYYPLTITPHGYKGQLQGRSLQSVKQVFRDDQKITIIGDAGSGKSTISKHLFMQCIKEQYKIPIFIELRNLDDKKNSLKEMFDKITDENQLSTNTKLTNELLKAGTFVFFLDGLDEISEEKKYNLLEDIDKFTSDYAKNNFFVTSRPYSGADFINGFTTYEINDLDDEDVPRFINFQLKDASSLAELIAEKIRLSDIVYINSFLKNPLLLSIFILTFQRNPNIPSQRHMFYRRVVNALFTEHDSQSKYGFQRKWETGLIQEQFEKVLKPFSYISYLEGEYSFHFDELTNKVTVITDKLKGLSFSSHAFIHDLKVNVALWVEDGGVISFAHRSIQEYFSALFIKELKSKNKEKAYKKIQLSGSKKVSENQHFLSLCQEIDNHDFNNYFLLPMINDLLSKIDARNPVESLLDLFFVGVTLSDKTVSSGKGLIPKLSKEASKYRYVLSQIDYYLADKVRSLNAVEVLSGAGLQRDYYEGLRTTYIFEEKNLVKKSLYSKMAANEDVVDQVEMFHKELLALLSQSEKQMADDNLEIQAILDLI